MRDSKATDMGICQLSNKSDKNKDIMELNMGNYAWNPLLNTQKEEIKKELSGKKIEILTLITVSHAKSMKENILGSANKMLYKR